MTGAYDWRRLGGEGFSNNSSGLSTEIEFSAASMAAIAAELTVPFGTSFVVLFEEDETLCDLAAGISKTFFLPKKILSSIKIWRL